TGGPADVDMLVSRAALKAELPECEVLLAREIEREVVEGRFHTGAACVVQFIARKR
ncbi:SAM-dependent methyltransferase, partial [Pseudomonas aeruginosa]|nr:SAM-dependent methyltransferase [Pseudomonas aeruginosa]